MHVALGSARIGCDAAIEMINRAHMHWRTWKFCAYWFKISYGERISYEDVELIVAVHLGSLTILAALIVDTNKRLREAPYERIVDPARADEALDMALEFLNAMATPGHPSLPPAATAGPARKTAIKSREMIEKIRRAIRSPSPKLNGATGSAGASLQYSASPGSQSTDIDFRAAFARDANDMSTRAFIQLIDGPSGFGPADATIAPQHQQQHDLRGWNGMQMLSSTSLPTSFTGHGGDHTYLHQPTAPAPSYDPRMPSHHQPPPQQQQQPAPSFHHHPPRPGVDFLPPFQPVNHYAHWPPPQPPHYAR